MKYTNIKYIAQAIIEVRALIGWGVRWLVEDCAYLTIIRWRRIDVNTVE